ncbi:MULTISPECIES: hypothetical protein [unclassified Pseudoalteromonas]|uniref:hypothetical protein n=1 Tax=unclassified Pseudoalteromonas TaxID=194690 RepID=UPI000CF74BAA|nr:MULTISPECIES: hypothetical protein [unclassified Pseudoalteromonas]
MKKYSLKTLSIFITLGLLASCSSVKEAGRDFGGAVKEVTTEIGHASRDAAKAIKKETKKVVSEINNNEE